MSTISSLKKINLGNPFYERVLLKEIMNSKTIKLTDIVSSEKLTELLQRKNLPGIFFLMSHIIAMLSTGYLVSVSFGTWWLVLSLVLHGIIIVHFFAPFHECSHGTAFRSLWANRILGWITGTSLFLIPAYFRYEHLAHHSLSLIHI